MKLLDSISSGESVLDIALRNSISFDTALKFYDSLFSFGLINRNLLTPEYVRDSK